MFQPNIDLLTVLLAPNIINSIDVELICCNICPMIGEECGRGQSDALTQYIKLPFFGPTTIQITGMKNHSRFFFRFHNILTDCKQILIFQRIIYKYFF